MRVFSHVSRKRLAIVSGFALVAVVVTSLLATGVIALDPAKNPPKAKPPIPLRNEPPPPFGPEQDLVQSNPVPSPVYGAKITIAGKEVQLPPDAALVGIGQADPIVMENGESLPCPLCDNSPVGTIVRGNSWVWIGMETGNVVSGEIAPSERGTFGFLKEVFPFQTKAIDSLPMQDSNGGGN